MGDEMASIAVPLISSLQRQTGSTIGRLEHLRSRRKPLAVQIAWLWALPTVPMVHSLSRDIGRGIRLLNDGAMDRLTQKELGSLAHALRQIHGRLRRMLCLFTDFGLSDMRPYKPVLDQLRDRIDHLDSIVEGIRLGLSPEFCGLVENAVSELTDATTHNEGSLVAHLPC